PQTTRSTQTDGVSWVTGNSFANEPFYPVKVVAAVNDGKTKQEMFRLSKLRNRAIVCDVNSTSTRVKPAHVRGINVLYANGGARWVDEGLFKKQLATPGFD